MSDSTQPQVPATLPASTEPTKTPSNKKDLALQSCIRLLLYMDRSMAAQKVDNTPLAVSIKSVLRLCSLALPNRFKLSAQETTAITYAANIGIPSSEAVSQSPILKRGDNMVPALPTPGKPVVLNLNQIKGPQKP